MGSLVRRMRKCKRCLGEVRVLQREEYQELELSTKVEMIRSLIPLGLMHVQMLLQEELEALTGPRYAREDGAAGMRYGSNAATAIPGAIGLSSSSVSRAFVEASAAKLKEFQERELSDEHYVALFLDGKGFADATLVVALGVTADGAKRFLGFVETDTENEKVLTPFL